MGGKRKETAGGGKRAAAASKAATKKPKTSRKTSRKTSADPGPKDKSPTTRAASAASSEQESDAMVRSILLDITAALCDETQSEQFYLAEAALLRAPLGKLDFGLVTGQIDDGASAQQGIRLSVQQAKLLHACLEDSSALHGVGQAIGDYISAHGGRLLVEINQSYAKNFEQLGSPAGASPTDVRYTFMTAELIEASVSAQMP